ncbi:MAG: hypothetical protein JXR05_10810 [Flavobacteriaceae bacterium]
MQIKNKHIALSLFLIDVVLLVLNIKYQDRIVSVIPDLNYAKLFFYVGILCLIICFLVAKFKDLLSFVIIIAIISFTISMFFNLRLAKNNYDRIKCNHGISEYYEYFEYNSCSKIEKRFEADVRNGEIKYFLKEYDSDLEFEEEMRDKHGIKLIGIECTMFTSMHCYNDLVIDYIKNKNSSQNFNISF